MPYDTRNPEKVLDKQSNCRYKIFSLPHLAVITVRGDDSAKFLQGQLSCDIYSISPSWANIAAFCNPKGRVISTLLVVKTAEGFFLLLPASLLNQVLKTLQKYILRSLVQLSSDSQDLQLFGLAGAESAETELNPASEIFGYGSDALLFIKLPATSRFICIAGQAESTDMLMRQNDFAIGSSDEWRFLDISSGFPWFETSQSELYIPQMLNIDGLGGVSFSKGCYTGQEIIARTHYLGKAKRSLFLVEAVSAQSPDSGISVIDSETQQTAGAILITQTFAGITRMLVVLQMADADTKKLVLDDANRTAIKIVPIQ